MVVDEVQRVPELLLAIKEDVDRDGRPGRYLLTGSANLMTLPRVADSLAGRMGVVRLLPLAHAELSRRPSAFLRSLFEGQTLTTGDQALGRELVEIVLGGGYLETLARKGRGVGKPGLSTTSTPSCCAMFATWPGSTGCSRCLA